MATDYDVIIIGQRAGGGTLARHLAPSGKTHPAARAWGLAAARAGKLGRGRRVREEPLRLQRHLVRPGRSGLPARASTTSWAARPRCTAPLCTACARRTSAKLRHYDGISPAWPIGYDELEPYYTKAESCITSTARAAKTRPSRRPARRIRSPAVTHEPRIQQLHDDLARAGYHPFHAPCGIMLNEKRSPSAPASAARTATASPAWSTPRPTPRCWAVRPALQYPNVTLVTHAQVHTLNTNAAGSAVTEVIVERNGETEHYRGGIVVVACGAANSAKLLLQSANDRHPHGLANGSDQVGRQLHVSQQHGGPGHLAGAEPHQVPEDPGAERFLLRHARLSIPHGQHPDGRQVARADVQGREADRGRARAHVVAGRAGRARHRFLALDRRLCPGRTTASRSTATATSS